MAEQLDDGEFWLPSQFLTDDDILMDFSPPLSNSNSSLGFGSSSDLGSLTESSDDDDILLLRSCPIHSKGSMLSTSPQSTLSGCVCNHQGSSRGSPSGTVSPPKEKLNEKKENGSTTLDLLTKAAGEVAKIRLRSESRSTGTGFFDCSNTAKGLLCPPPPQPPSQSLRSSTYFPPFYTHPPQFHHFPAVMWTPPPFQQALQSRVALKNNANAKSNNVPVVNNTRPLGLPPSAWPPLPGQVQAQPPPQAQPQAQSVFVGAKRDSVGTGVFLPRRVNTPSDSRKKSDVNATKTKSNKVSQRRNNKCQSTTLNSEVKDDEIQLPSEWVY